MRPTLRKFVLSVHLTFSVGWIGAVIMYLGLSLATKVSRDAQVVRAGWIAMELTGWYVIVPLAGGSLLTGLVMALGTKWGLLRHYWVLFSLFLTLGSAIVLILHMPEVSLLAEAARWGENGAFNGADAHPIARLSEGDLLHPALGLLVLLVVQFLNLYKPQGMTPYGWRKQNERHPS